MEKLKRKLIHSLMLPVYWSAHLVPKDPQVWTFGAWLGKKYNDNPKYLFEHVNRHQPEVKAVWLTTSDDTRRLVRSKGYRCHHPFSPAGLYYSLRSRVNVFCVSQGKDTHMLWPHKMNVNLWHGIPLKKIGFDNQVSGEADDSASLVRRVKDRLYPFLARRAPENLVIASSHDEKKSLVTAFRIDADNIVINGSPRLDAFYLQPQAPRRHRNILYMPTHRNEGELNVTDLLMRELDVLDAALDGADCTFFVKLHFYNLHEAKTPRTYRNIVFLTDEMIEQDIYSFLPKVDLLITDYSSVYFDFLLADRPIIFAPFDFEDYLAKDRELYYDYDEVTPGPKCRDWNEVVHWIRRFIDDPTLYRAEREALRNRFHQYQDGRNCERVVKTVFALQETRPVWWSVRKAG